MAMKWGGSSKSNLQSFLDSITPSVPCQRLPKSWCQDVKNLWQPVGKDSVEFFILGDLWDQYYEWSAYGASVPVRLHSGEMVVQYYVPYLSGIQLYTRKPLSASSIDVITRKGIMCEKLAETDAASEGIGLCNKNPWGASKNIGHLYLEFFECASPYTRIPLLDKVIELSHTRPNLISSKSIELSPASWMSVAWYPIYHIPTRRSVKELSTCFLTYHTLSSLVQEDTLVSGMKNLRTTEEGKKGVNSKEKNSCISLQPFGLATYKLQGTLWTPPQSGDWEKISCLYNAAGSWLKQLNVKHHDFTYFSTRFP